MTARYSVLFAVVALSGPANPAFGQINPCALVTAAEAEAAAGTKVGAGQVSHLAPTDTYVCEYKWTAKAFSPSVQVSVSDASKMWPGMDAATIKSGILGGPKGFAKNVTAVSGVGVAATYTQTNDHSGSAIAYLKGKLLEVTYQATDSPAKKNQVIGLLKTAASRL